MSESSYQTLKAKSVSLLTFENKRVSIAVLVIVNLVFLAAVVTDLPFIFLFAVALMTVVMVALFVGLFQQAIGFDSTPDGEVPPADEVDTKNLQLACSLVFDMLNDFVQGLRNIITLRSPKIAVLVLALLSLVTLLSHLTNDLVFLWILFNLAFLVPWKVIEEGKLQETVKEKLHVSDYAALLDKIPKCPDENEDGEDGDA
eukprot:TRINITY_DN686_c0_g1_i9.p2 TRINITY_DN686_c0_g1~~TRINITY_DN686_c0_g1_i9.p2  ORF type:complete len:201 (-),score=67.92 TRINITY_DN686_c0_g1_i9:178-780(-)